jgi:hypothetical protein
MIKAKATPLVEGKALELPAGRLSPSQVEMYLRCALQYFFRYVEGLKVPPGVALVQGASVHVSLEENNKHKLRTGSDLPVKRVVECFNDAFSKKRREVRSWGGLDEKKARAEVVVPLTDYMRSCAAGVRPVEVERRILAHIGGVPAMIVVDLIDEAVAGDESHAAELGVSDYKAVGKAKSDGDAANSLQLMSYARAVGVPSGRFVSLVKGSAVKVTKRAKYSQRELRWLDEIYRRVALSITAGVFPPADPGAWVCAARWCGYWKRCRGKRQ